jgi:hypothetical protein
MSIRRGASLAIDGAVEHVGHDDDVALVATGRLNLGALAFVETMLPLAYDHALRATAAGNAMFGAGLLPAADRIVGVELRVAVPTSPRAGDGMTAVAADAAPRVADPELFLAHTTSVELVADWRWRTSTSWLQAEAGVGGWWHLTGYETVLRATLAGGVAITPWLDATASFVTRSFVLASDSPDDFVHAVMLGVVGHLRRGELTVRVELPLDGGYLVGLELRGL